MSERNCVGVVEECCSFPFHSGLKHLTSTKEKTDRTVSQLRQKATSYRTIKDKRQSSKTGCPPHQLACIETQYLLSSSNNKKTRLPPEGQKHCVYGDYIQWQREPNYLQQMYCVEPKPMATHSETK